MSKILTQLNLDSDLNVHHQMSFVHPEMSEGFSQHQICFRCKSSFFLEFLLKTIFRSPNRLGGVGVGILRGDWGGVLYLLKWEQVGPI